MRPTPKRESHLTGLSKKSTEQQTLRHLAMQRAGTVEPEPEPMSPNRVSVRKRLANEAGPPAADLWQRDDYVVGNGDPHTYSGRPGAFDHINYKSKGTLT